MSTSFSQFIENTLQLNTKLQAFASASVKESFNNILSVFVEKNLLTSPPSITMTKEEIARTELISLIEKEYTEKYAAPLLSAEEKDDSLLAACCRRGLCQSAQDLISVGFDVNATNPKTGMCPLLYASYCCDAETIAALFDSPFHNTLNSGTDIVTKGLKNSPLHLACSNGLGGLPENTCAEIAAELLLHNVSPNAVNASGEYPIHCVAASGVHDEIWKGVIGDLAISSGDMKNHVNVLSKVSGETPLHVAARENRGEMVSVLIALGADKNAKMELTTVNDSETNDDDVLAMNTLTPLLLTIVKTCDENASKTNSAFSTLLRNGTRIELTPVLSKMFKRVSDFAEALGKPNMAAVIRPREEESS